MTGFRLLGPVEVSIGDRPLALGTAKQQAVLAMLLVEAGRPVATDTLVAQLWDGSCRPTAARGVVYSHLSRIRQLLRRFADETETETALERRSGGYLIRCPRQMVDLHRFRSLVELARDAGRPESERLRLLREAVNLWRGEPLAALPGEWANGIREACRHDHLDAVTLWARGELAAGYPASVIGPVSDLVRHFPLAEALIVELMRALHAAGRPAEALEHYIAIRKRLADELGVDPGAELVAAQRAILRRAPHTAGVGPPRIARSAPALLPLDAFGFVGRTDYLTRLDAILDAAREQPTATIIAALSGTAGVGKTALAVHWAHRVRHRFPDGQLHVDLRGFDPAGAMPSREAVRRFLDALGVAPQRIPRDPAAQADLYRSEIAGRRMLILLDNARNSGHVRAMLPGSPSVVMLVTSRDHLFGLVATRGAHPVTLHMFTPAEARELLARRLGRDRVAAEPAAVDEIVQRCAGLPLALTIIGARAAAHPEFPLMVIAAQLGSPDGGLDALVGPDGTTDLRTVFSWSYRTLSAPAARLFRLLSTHPGLELSAAAAASIAGVALDRAGPLLTELAGAHVINESLPGRYALPTLLRGYAGELAGRYDSAADRDAALHRLLGHYLQTAHAAAAALDPHQGPVPPLETGPGVTAELLSDRHEALTWFAMERGTLLAAVRRAAEAGYDRHALHLSSALAGYLDRCGLWADEVAALRVALEAAAVPGRPRRPGAHPPASGPTAGSSPIGHDCLRETLPG
jgi:DNA-binding SARP family transcriptional activator